MQAKFLNPGEKTALKFYPRLNLYKAANVKFNPATLEAYSYDWWKFVVVIDGLVVFNEYRYSVTTSKHQRKVQTLLNQLGISVDIYVEAPRGLQDLQSAFAYHTEQEREFRAKAEKARSRKGEYSEMACLHSARSAIVSNLIARVGRRTA